MLTLDFTDKCVPYDVFVRDLASELAGMIAVSRNDPETVSQRRAYRMFGRANVERWRRAGDLEPLSVRPGKTEYRTADLRLLQRRTQDYFGSRRETTKPSGSKGSTAAAAPREAKAPRETAAGGGSSPLLATKS